jgi:hypothetical protein
VCTCRSVKGSARFTQILAALMRARGDLFAVKNELILQEMQRRIAADLFDHPSRRLDAEDKAWLELCLKRAGQLQPESAITVVGNQVDVSIGERIAADVEAIFAPFSRQSQGRTSDPAAQPADAQQSRSE